MLMVVKNHLIVGATQRPFLPIVKLGAPSFLSFPPVQKTEVPPFGRDRVKSELEAGIAETTLRPISAIRGRSCCDDNAVVTAAISRLVEER